MPDPGLPVDTDRSDRDELQEVIREFLYRYNFLHEKRIHKLLFYGELYTLQHYNHRLSDANFKPYYYGPYADVITATLDDLTDTPTVHCDDSGDARRYMANSPGALSDEKREIIAAIDAETHDMSTEELVRFSKTTWLWKQTQMNTAMDFEEYMAAEMVATDTVSDAVPDDRDPVEADSVDELVL